MSVGVPPVGPKAREASWGSQRPDLLDRRHAAVPRPDGACDRKRQARSPRQLAHIDD